MYKLQSWQQNSKLNLLDNR